MWTDLIYSRAHWRSVYFQVGLSDSVKSLSLRMTVCSASVCCSGSAILVLLSPLASLSRSCLRSRTFGAGNQRIASFFTFVKGQVKEGVFSYTMSATWISWISLLKITDCLVRFAGCSCGVLVTYSISHVVSIGAWGKILSVGLVIFSQPHSCEMMIFK